MATVAWLHWVDWCSQSASTVSLRVEWTHCKVVFWAAEHTILSDSKMSDIHMVWIGALIYTTRLVTATDRSVCTPWNPPIKSWHSDVGVWSVRGFNTHTVSSPTQLRTDDGVLCNPSLAAGASWICIFVIWSTFAAEGFFSVKWSIVKSLGNMGN